MIRTQKPLTQESILFIGKESIITRFAIFVNRPSTIYAKPKSGRQSDAFGLTNEDELFITYCDLLWGPATANKMKKSFSATEIGHGGGGDGGRSVAQESRVLRSSC